MTTNKQDDNTPKPDVRDVPLADVRDVPLDDVSWKVQTTGTKANGDLWCLWVAYADARIYGERLDAWVGEFGWSDTYKMIDVAGKPAVECQIRLHRDHDKDNPLWLDVLRHGWAEIDVGGREQVKGAESDAFKRAGAKCGIGRNLYRLPKLCSKGTEITRDGKKVVVAPRMVGDLTIDDWLQEELTRQLGDGE